MPIPHLVVDTRDARRAWAQSGGMALTGAADGPPLAPPAPVASVLAATGFADAAALVGERGLTRNGSISCGGATRLLACADGWLAVAMARPTDEVSVPAWLGVPASWDAIASRLADLPAATALEGARLLELPVAQLGEAAPVASPWRISQVAPSPALSDPPFVLDLSSLWAGPLCGDLLARSGATVVKVEDPRRPDGARLGAAPFFDLLNSAKRSVAVELSSTAFRRLLARADVVISSARPRAFEQLGIDVAAVLSARPVVWVAITAYGWEGPERNRVGFGDDVAVAAGLVTMLDGRPGFVADAVADPLCGTLAAFAALRCVAAGGSWFVDAPLVGAAAYTASLADNGTVAADGRDDGQWVLADGTPVAPPRTRTSAVSARPMGADNAQLLGR
ncbi:MAG: CoA transferase [Acidimicrobiales bacterium]